MTIRLSRFNNKFATEPTVIPCADFDALIDHLGTHVEYASKEDAPLFCPAEFAGPRSKASVTQVNFAVLDIDKLPVEEIDAVVNRMNDAELSWMLYTTYSNSKYLTNNRVAFRLVVPIDRPVMAHEWDAFWSRLNTLAGGFADKACKDPSRMYYYPSCPVGEKGTDGVFYHYQDDGNVLCVDDLLDVAPVIDPDLRNGGVTHRDLKNLASRLVRRNNTYLRTVGERLRLIADGESFADVGERDSWVYKITSVLVEEFPDASAENLAANFKVSLSVMSATSPDCPTVDDVEYKIRRHQNEQEADAVAEESKARAEFRRRLKSVGRSEAYSATEIQQWCSRMGIDSMDGHWVIQKDRSYWVMVNGEYVGPYTQNEIIEAAENKLAPAQPLGVSVWVDGEDGKRHLMRPSILISKFGSVADSIEIDLTAQSSSFKNGILTEAPCPIREKFEPKFDGRVDGWLRAMAGDRAERLLDWVSVVTQIDKPCAALYLEGAKGVGKSLLAFGLGQLWTDDGPTPLDRVLGANFNTMLTQCPLLFADEIFPHDHRGQPMTGELRQLVQARRHAISEKFVTDRTMKGCVRVVIAANNRSLISGNANLTQDDISAIVERILHIRVCGEASDYLKALSATDREEMATRAIAEHALWLAQNREVKQDSRFLVSGDHGELHTALTVDSGLRSSICNWLVQYLLDPGRIVSTGTLQVRVDKGDVLVTAGGLLNRWDSYTTNQKSPRVSEISTALSGLSDGRRYLSDENGRRTKYWRVSTSNLTAWADNHGYATPDQIAETIANWGAKPVLVQDAAS